MPRRLSSFHPTADRPTSGWLSLGSGPSGVALQKMKSNRAIRLAKKTRYERSRVLKGRRDRG